MADINSSAYAWNQEFFDRQIQKYPAENTPAVATFSGVHDLITKFLSASGDMEPFLGPSTYQILELEPLCKSCSIDILLSGTDPRVTRPMALLDDRCRRMHHSEPPGGHMRRDRGPLSSSQLLQELKKSNVTGYTSTDAGPLIFGLEFHLQYYVWCEGGPQFHDSRKKRNGKPLRQSRQPYYLKLGDENEPQVHIYETQVSCLIAGIDEDSWVAYQFVDTYYQGEKPLAQDEQHGVKPDPLTGGLFDANLPIWTPREYFLIVYECRLKQVRHAMHNLIARLLLRLEPYTQDEGDVATSLSEGIVNTMDQKKLMQRILNEANRFLPQTIHSICKAIEVWDRLSRRDLAYLSDILKSDSKKSPIPSVKVVTMIEDHIDALRDLQRRAEEQRDLCTGLARKLEMQIVVEDNEVTARQQAGTEMTRYWTGIGLVFLPLTAVTGIFSMQPGILPDSFYKWWIFIIFWIVITLLVILAVEFRSLRSSIPTLRSDRSCSRISPSWYPFTSRLSLLSSSTDFPAEIELIPRSPVATEVLATDMFDSIKTKALLVACLVFSGSALPNGNGKRHWVGTWASMPQEVEPANLAPAPFGGVDAAAQFENTTLRQTFHMSIGADKIRIRFSNIFGKTNLPITAASIALPVDGKAGVGQIDTKTTKQLKFKGKKSVSVPVGEIVYSDPIDFKLKPLSNLALSVYTEKGQLGNKITGHPGSRTTSWMQKGNHVNAASVSEGSTKHWYFANGVDSWAPKDHFAVVLLGDSITDGRGSTDDTNDRWSDALAAHLQESGMSNVAVNNMAAGGNAILSGGLGPILLQRYKRDALEQPGAKFVIIFEGVNDIGPSATDEATQKRIKDGLIAAYTQIAKDIKKAGLSTIGATITQMLGNQYYAPEREVTRVSINDWILKNGTFDHIVDFAALIGSGDKLLPQYDSGDGLHPNPAAYKLMGTKFPIQLFKK
ncbi:transcription factor SEF1 [Fusarium pseudocircinatum]|uniref:Transcription factor SEF1 n=1 Tax=Fusarium pseudocircinatum TaxID=56676 RepID=A0A8H5KPU5_9HYPO|nr:transcription factor SEF1 [Fusarium pseudocircinatum]